MYAHQMQDEFSMAKQGSWKMLSKLPFTSRVPSFNEITKSPKYLKDAAFSWRHWAICVYGTPSIRTPTPGEFNMTLSKRTLSKRQHKQKHHARAWQPSRRTVNRFLFPDFVSRPWRLEQENDRGSNKFGDMLIGSQFARSDPKRCRFGGFPKVLRS